MILDKFLLQQCSDPEHKLFFLDQSLTPEPFILIWFYMTVLPRFSRQFCFKNNPLFLDRHFFTLFCCLNLKIENLD